MTQPGFEQVGVEAVIRGFDAYVRNLQKLNQETVGAGAGAAKAAPSFGSLGKQIVAFGSAIAGVQLGIGALRSGFTNTIGAAVGFESTLAGIAKTVDASDAEIQAIGQSMRDLAKDIPVPVEGLNRIGEAAGQLGISKGAIVGFTETIAQLAASTNLTADEAANAFARIANITGLAEDQFQALGSALVALGNNSAATESEIVEFALRIAGAGEIAGLTEDQIFAIGSAMASVGVEAEAGGTAIQKVLLSITEAVNTSNDDLEVFAETAGLSAEEFARAFREDAGEAFRLFVEGLGAQGQQAFGTLEALELQDQRLIRAFLALAGAGDLLNEQMQIGATAIAENSALTEEFGKRVETSASQFQIFQNNIRDVGIDIGGVLVPKLVAGSQAITAFIDAFRAGEGPAGLLADLLPSIATGAAALAAALAVQRIVAWAQALQAATLAAGGLSTVMLGPVGLVAAVIALDVATRAITGSGLFETLAQIFGNVDREARGATAATRELALELARAGPGADAAAIAVKELNEDISSYKAALAIANGETSASVAEWHQAVNALGDFEGAIKSQIEGLQAFGLSNREIVDIVRELPPELRASIEATDAYKLILAALQGEIQRTDAAFIQMQASNRRWLEGVEETASGMEGLGDVTQATAEELEEAAKRAEDFADALQDSIGDVFDQILPDVTGSVDDWVGELERLLQGYENLEGNLNAIYGVLQAGNVENADAIIGVLRAKGPEFVADFIKFFAEDPAAALEVLGKLSPLLMTEAVNQAASSLEDGAPAIGSAAVTAFLDPTAQVLGGVITIAGNAGAQAGAAFSSALATSIAGGFGGAVAGVPAGIGTGIPAATSLPQAMEDLGLQALKNFLAGLSGGSSSGGSGGGVAKEALDAVGRFINAMADEVQSADYIDRFGSAGAALAESLVQSMEAPTEAGIDRLAGNVAKFLDEIEKAGVKTGTDLPALIAEALRNNDQAAVNAILALVENLASAAELTTEEAAVNLVDTFTQAVVDGANSREAVDRMGSTGARLIDALTKGIADNDEKAIAQAAKLADDIISTLEDEFGTGGKVGELAANLIDLITQAITEGGGPALAALEDFLKRFNAAVSGAKKGGTSIGLPGSLFGGGFTGPASEDPSLALNQRAASLFGYDPFQPRVGPGGGGTGLYYDPGGAELSPQDVINLLLQLEQGKVPTFKVRSAVTGQTYNFGSGGTVNGIPYEELSQGEQGFIDPQTGAFVPAFHEGTNYVPRDMLALIHQGEQIVPAYANPYATVASSPPMLGGSPTYIIDVDVNGEFSGTPQDNARAIVEQVREVLADELADVTLYARR